MFFELKGRGGRAGILHILFGLFFLRPRKIRERHQKNDPCIATPQTQHEGPIVIPLLNKPTASSLS
jgi:hypothetical protein